MGKRSTVPEVSEREVRVTRGVRMGQEMVGALLERARC
jgi:hypothetical protein